jgi:hypothetical protein
VRGPDLLAPIADEPFSDADRRAAVLPLSELPDHAQTRIQTAVARSHPPSKWVRLAHAIVPSRAYFEWFWQRGRPVPGSIEHAELPRRPKITPAMRRRVLERDGWVCGICIQPIADGDLHIDHIVPLVAGGAHAVENMQPAHAACNIRKGAR